MAETVAFILLLSWLTITNRIGVFSGPKFNPSSLLPVGLDVKINTKFLSLTIKIYLIIESIRDFLIISSWGNTDLDSTNPNRMLQHLSPHFHLIGVLILSYLNNRQLSLCDEQNNSNGGLVAGKSDTNIGVGWIHQQLPLSVHLKEEITGLHEEFLLISLGGLHILLIIRDQLTGAEISIITTLITQSLQIWLIGRSALYACGILHGDIGKRDVLVNERDLLQLSFLVDIEHDLSLDLGQ